MFIIKYYTKMVFDSEGMMHTKHCYISYQISTAVHM